jgi:hypothetical protein
VRIENASVYEKMIITIIDIEYVRKHPEIRMDKTIPFS